ncbi:hypothetical protein [Paludibaculum fermentans]|uniref:Uncharacterized protein n=1 Tax=Paludibaculum fermentans TaxID=1473598 RepID=A0A7S7SM19_PALFE|nr:hypothetical protein [Paludibaculum fermentans]QOY88630.1 hypothetical protein IRI77_01320 [Paludibaculum fermentans]
MASIQPRFIFRGDAVGAAGRLVRNARGEAVNQIVPVLAASSLPVIGGISEAKAENCTVPMPGGDQPFLCVGLAATSAMSEGDGLDKDHTTTVKCSVEKVQILNRLTLDSIKVSIVSRHPPEEEVARIAPDIAELTGLKLDGHELAVSFDLKTFQRNPTKQALVDYYAKTASFREKSGWRVSADSPKRLRPPEFKGIIFATVVTSIKWVGEPLPGVEICGNVVRWPGVGTIYLGELLISKHSRRLTMFRMEIGGNMETLRTAPKMTAKALKLAAARAPEADQGGGEVVLGETQTNGTTIP